MALGGGGFSGFTGQAEVAGQYGSACAAQAGLLLPQRVADGCSVALGTCYIFPELGLKRIICKP